MGISNESASISNGIAKSLSQAGAKVYVAPSQNNKSEKKWPKIEQPYRNKNVFPIQGKCICINLMVQTYFKIGSYFSDEKFAVINFHLSRD